MIGLYLSPEGRTALEPSKPGEECPRQISSSRGERQRKLSLSPLWERQEKTIILPWSETSVLEEIGIFISFSGGRGKQSGET